MIKSIGIDSTKIASLLGQVASPLISIVEMLKNSIDAGANNIEIQYDTKKNSITVLDDGDGFDLESIQNLNPGVSSKKNHGQQFNKNKIFYTGSKGLGLLSGFSICDNIIIKTCSQSDGGYLIKWRKNDGGFEYNSLVDNFHIGSSVELQGISPETMKLIVSEDEIIKLKHISTYIYKNNVLPFPNVILRINGGLAAPIFAKVDEFPLMQYDVNFTYGGNNKLLDFTCLSKDGHLYSCTLHEDNLNFNTIHKILTEKFGVKIIYKNRFAEFLLDNINGVPSFEGRFLIYERLEAGELRKFGHGVNLYVNDFALYNYLERSNDWLELGNFSQRVKATTLKSHNVFGYINLPEFDENNQLLKISNERADFIQDTEYLKLMYIIKGIILLMVLNIDVHERAMKKKRTPGNKDSGSKKTNNPNQEEKKEDSNPRNNEGTPPNNDAEQAPFANNAGAKAPDKDDQGKDTDESQGYTPSEKYFLPKSEKFKHLKFAEEDASKILAIKDKNELGIKINQLVYELANLSFEKFPFAVVGNYRSLIEAATRYVSPSLGIEYKEDYLQAAIINVLNEWGKLPDRTKLQIKDIGAWREVITKRNLCNILNSYVHYGRECDNGYLFDTWKTMKNYIIRCVEDI